MAAAGSVAEIEATGLKTNKKRFNHEVNIKNLPFHAYHTGSTMKSHGCQ